MRKRHITAWAILLGLWMGVPEPMQGQIGGVGGIQIACSPPSDAQCHDGAWIEGACGNQYKHLCEDVWDEDASSFQAPRELSRVPGSFSQSGIGFAYDDSPGGEPLDVVPDPRSYTSLELASAYAPSSVGGTFGVDLHAIWAGNGSRVNSCDEYVYEKYYGLTRFLKRIGTHRDDPRHVVDEAYANTNADWAIGTRHEGFQHGLSVAGYDGTSAGGMWSTTNSEFGFAPYRHTLMRDLPSVLDAAIRKVHAGGRAGLERRDAIPPRKRERPQSWAEQRWLNENLSYEGRPSMGIGTTLSAGVLSNEDFDVPRDDIETLGSLLGNNWDAGVPRRYLDDELNEWFERMKRVDELVSQWRALDEQYEGSGWTIAKLPTPPVVTTPGSITIGTQTPTPNTAPVPVRGGLRAAAAPRAASTTRTASATTVAAGPTRTAPTRTTPTRTTPETTTGTLATTITATPLLDAETSARLRIAKEIGKILGEANQDGCFESELLGPCDWSPEGFTHRMYNHFRERMDDRAASCDAFLASFGTQQLPNLAGHTVSYTPPSYFPSEEKSALTCSVTAPAYFTRASLESYMGGVESCRRKREMGEAMEQALGEAVEALESADKDAFFEDGELGDTNWQTSATEILGSEYFGVGMSYDISYGIERDPDHEILEPSFCESRLYAKSYSSIDAYVYKKPINLLEVDAAIDTRDDAQRADLRAKIIGHEAFEKGGTWGQGGNLNWNLVDVSADWTKTQKVAQFTYWIGPVPVGIEAGIAGRVGVDLDVTAGLDFFDGSACMQGDVTTTVRPLAAVSGYVFVGLDIWIAKVGVRGFLDIIELGLPLTSRLELAARSEGNDLVVDLTSSTRLDVDVVTLSGRIEAFAGAFGKEWSKTIVSWPGIGTTKPIFNHSYTVDLLTLHNAFAFAEGL